MVKPPVVGRSIMAVALSEGARNWPFVFGFCVTIGIVVKMSMGLNRKYRYFFFFSMWFLWVNNQIFVI
jgi:hypothetical protein